MVQQVGLTKLTGFNDLASLPVLNYGSGIQISFQGHHVINTATAENSAVMRAMYNSNLFDANSFHQNGLALPDSHEGARFLGVAKHNGGHTAYNEFIGRVVGAFDKAYEQRAFGSLTEAQWLHQSAEMCIGAIG